MKQAISLDVVTGSCRLQPIYFEAVWNPLLTEILNCDWPKHRPRAERLKRHVEEEWNRWRKAKAEIDADWHREQLKRVAAVALEIDRDKAQQQMEDIMTAEVARCKEDEKAVLLWLDKLAAAIKKEKANWLAEAKARLVAATAEMNRDIVKTERKVFVARGVLKGRHK